MCYTYLKYITNLCKGVKMSEKISKKEFLKDWVPYSVK